MHKIPKSRHCEFMRIPPKNAESCPLNRLPSLYADLYQCPVSLPKKRRITAPLVPRTGDQDLQDPIRRSCAVLLLVVAGVGKVPRS